MHDPVGATQALLLPLKIRALLLTHRWRHTLFPSLTKNHRSIERQRNNNHRHNHRYNHPDESAAASEAAAPIPNQTPLGDHPPAPGGWQSSSGKAPLIRLRSGNMLRKDSGKTGVFAVGDGLTMHRLRSIAFLGRYCRYNGPIVETTRVLSSRWV